MTSKNYCMYVQSGRFFCIFIRMFILFKKKKQLDPISILRNYLVLKYNITKYIRQKRNSTHCDSKMLNRHVIDPTMVMHN